MGHRHDCHDDHGRGGGVRVRGRRSLYDRVHRPACGRAREPQEARAAQVVAAATEATTANREAAEAWDALATHAGKQAGECRHGAELAERTRRRWAH